MIYKIRIWASVGEATIHTNSIPIVTGTINAFLEKIEDDEDTEFSDDKGFAVVRVYKSDGDLVGSINYEFTYDTHRFNAIASNGQQTDEYSSAQTEDWTVYQVQQFMTE